MRAFYVSLSQPPTYEKVSVEKIRAFLNTNNPFQIFLYPELKIYILFSNRDRANPLIQKVKVLGDAVVVQLDENEELTDLSEANAEYIMNHGLGFHIPLKTYENNKRIPTEIGKPFEFFKQPKNMGDGALLEALEHDQGFMLVIYLEGITKTEIEHINKKECRLSIYQEEQYAFTIFEFGKLSFEATFDPTLYSVDHDWTIEPKLFIVGVDSKTNLVKTLRHASIPLKLMLKWKSIWERASKTENYAKKYEHWHQDVRRIYPIQTILERSTYLGKLGTM